MPKKCWICDKCQCWFETQELATNCENIHSKNKDLKVLAVEYSKNNPLPDVVSVDNGHVVAYYKIISNINPV